MRGRRSRLVLVVLLLIALTLIAIDLRSGKTGTLRKAGSAVLGPIENGLSSAFRPVGSWFSGLVHLNSYKSENDKLRSEVQTLRNEVQQQRADEQNYQRLLAANHLAGRGRFRIVTAHVVSLSPGGLNLKWTIAIDAGTADGIRLDQTVVDADGLVGRVIRASRTSSTVLLAMDKDFAAGVFIESSRVEGTLHGEDLGAMQLQLFDPQDPVRVGDRLVTVDDDAIFAPQIPVGTVTKVEPGTTATGGREALVQPFVHFSRLGGATVEVIVGHPRSLPRGSLLPPKPTSSASATSGSTSGTTSNSGGSGGATSGPGTSASTSPTP